MTLTFEKYIIQHLDEKKATDIVSIPMKHQSSLMDTMIIATGTSLPHLNALVKNLSSLFAQQPPLSISGLPGTTWVIVDFGSVVVHLFTSETRSFYDLESMWHPEAFHPPKHN